MTVKKLIWGKPFGSRRGLTWNYQLGEMAPWYMGHVRHAPERLTSVMAPIPLNVLFRLCWVVWVWFRYPIEEGLRERQRNEWERQNRRTHGFEVDTPTTPEKC